MEFIIDTADLGAIKRIVEFFPVTGVTTNPSIISKEKADFKQLVLALREAVGPDKQLHVQTTCKKAEEIVREAEELQALVGGEFYIKIPVGPEGLKATMMLKKKGIGVTMTAIFTAQQALQGALAGATYVAPYVNRLDNVCADGVGVVADIVNLFDVHGLDCKVLAASFKNVQQVHDVAMCGGHAVTINPELYDQIVYHPLTDKAINDFDSDWAGVYGEKGILDLIK